MLYGRVASGYRPGGANTELFGVTVPPTFGPDKLVSYELGIKSELFDKKLLLDVTGYYIDWTDIQVSQRSPTQAVYVGNAGRAVSKGVEFTTAFVFMESFRVSLNGAYTDAILKSDAPALGASAGDRLPYTPKFAGAITADWTHELGSDYDAGVHASWRYVGARQSNFPLSETGDAHLPSYDVVDLTGDLSHGPWRANLFLRNLTDKHAYLSAEAFGAAILQPRTFGVGVEYRFASR